MTDLQPRAGARAGILQTPRTIDPAKTFDEHVAWVRELAVKKGAPGMIVGLSGTDSILTFLICAKAYAELGKADRVVGVHYRPERSESEIRRIKEINPQYGWFTRDIIPWLQQQAPGARILVESPVGYNDDFERWADLSRRSLNEVVKTERGPRSQPLPEGGNYWVAGTRNATEEVLGTYSNISKLASVQPIMDLWKSEVLKICASLGVPRTALDMSRVPDCLCGRAETAAENIEPLDALLMVRKRLLDSAYLKKHYSPELLKKLRSHVQGELRINGFKPFIPHTPKRQRAAKRAPANKL